MGVAGNAELIAAVSEADRCAKQLKLESVRQDPPHMRFWLDRYSVVCERLLRAAEEGMLVLPTAPPSSPACAWACAVRFRGMYYRLNAHQ